MNLSPEAVLMLTAAAVLTGMVGAVGWLLRRAIKDVDDKIGALTVEMHATTATVAQHGQQLAVHEYRLSRLDGSAVTAKTA